LVFAVLQAEVILKPRLSWIWQLWMERWQNIWQKYLVSYRDQQHAASSVERISKLESNAA